MAVIKNPLPGAVLGLPLLALTLGGCARNLCELDPTDPRCAVSPPGGSPMLTVSPMRLSLSTGGQVVVEVKPAPAEGSQLVLRRPGAPDLALGTATGGTLTVDLKPGELGSHGFTPGEAQVALLQPGQPDRTAALRLFVAPQFSQPAKVYDSSVNSDYPIWIGIGRANTVYTLNQFPPFAGSSERQLRIGEYRLTNSLLSPTVPQTFGAYRAYPFATVPPGLAALGGATVLVLSKNPVNMNNPILADLCLFSTGMCQSLNPMALDFKSAVGLAADQKGSLFAVQTELGTLAYRASDMSPFAEKLTVDSTGRPTPGAVVAQAVGDIDGDGQSDVLAFQSAPTGVSVFLRLPGGKQLRYNDAVSGRLQALLGNKAPAAAAAADLDADGLDDLLMVRDGALGLFFNQGNGTLTAGAQVAVPPGADSVAVGVIDPAAPSWGRLDIAVSSSTGQRIAVFMNQASL